MLGRSTSSAVNRTAQRADKEYALRYDWRGNSLIVMHNFDEKPHEIRIKPGIEGGERLVNLLVENQSEADKGGTHRLALEAYGYRWFRIGSLNHILRRTRV